MITNFENQLPNNVLSWSIEALESRNLLGGTTEPLTTPVVTFEAQEEQSSLGFWEIATDYLAHPFAKGKVISSCLFLASGFLQLGNFLDNDFSKSIKTHKSYDPLWLLLRATINTLHGLSYYDNYIDATDRAQKAEDNATFLIAKADSLSWWSRLDLIASTAIQELTEASFLVYPALKGYPLLGLQLNQLHSFHQKSAAAYYFYKVCSGMMGAASTSEATRNILATNNITSQQWPTLSEAASYYADEYRYMPEGYLAMGRLVGLLTDTGLSTLFPDKNQDGRHLIFITLPSIASNLLYLSMYFGFDRLKSLLNDNKPKSFPMQLGYEWAEAFQRENIPFENRATAPAHFATAWLSPHVESGAISEEDYKALQNSSVLPATQLLKRRLMIR